MTLAEALVILKNPTKPMVGEKLELYRKALAVVANAGLRGL